MCCTEMLQKWLEKDFSATWGELNDAIKKIKQPYRTCTTTPLSIDKRGNN